MNDVNLMDLVPVKSADFYTNPENNLIIIKKPKIKNQLLKKHIKLKSPFYRINLDAVGTFVWQNIDGKNNVYKIANNLEKEFGDKVKPVYERIGKFMQMLESNKFIVFKK